MLEGRRIVFLHPSPWKETKNKEARVLAVLKIREDSKNPNRKIKLRAHEAFGGIVE